VAALVGTILLVINQYDALFGNEPIRLIPAVLTYIVPFIVFLIGNFSKSRG
jgi:methyl-accepting chemotaxis protein